MDGKYRHDSVDSHPHASSDFIKLSAAPHRFTRLLLKLQLERTKYTAT